MKDIRPFRSDNDSHTFDCVQLERNNISFRLQSERKRYIEKGGKLERKTDSVKNSKTD